jgi:hypothetical protein
LGGREGWEAFQTLFDRAGIIHETPDAGFLRKVRRKQGIRE